MISRRIALGSLLGASLLGSGGMGVAHANSAATALVESVTQQVIALIRSSQSIAQKEAQFGQILDANSDLRQIAGFAVGRYARSMSPAQKDRYVAAFKRFVTRTYVARFDEYQGEQLRLGNVQDGGNRGVLVNTEFLRPGQAPFVVGWLVSDRSGRSQVVDLIVEGISMAQSLRSEFTSKIDQYGGDIDRFIADLETR